MWQSVKVLIIDDNKGRRHDLRVILDFLGEPAVATGYRDWQRAAAENGKSPQEFAAVILVDCDKQQGLKQRLQQLWEWDRNCPVILAGEHQDVEDSWEPYLTHMILGTLPLPPAYGTLLDILHRAQHYRDAVAAAAVQQSGGRPAHLFRSLVGSSRKIQDLRKVMEKVADRDITVLITGEAGTGKEVVARNLHYRSPRSKGPFVPVDCRAIPEELLEAELFGQHEGAGVLSARSGRVHMAQGGTLFLEGVGDMPAAVQVKMLRLLQYQVFERVGGNESEQADLRIIAASHHDLEELIQAGRFNQDLYYALNVVSIEMPALRERSEDLPLMINELIARLEGEKRGSVRFNSAAIMSLCRHPWPGNARELANLVERMAIAYPCGVVGVRELPAKYRHLEVESGSTEATVEQLTTGYQPSMVSMADRALLPHSGIDLKEYLSNLERNLIQQALADSGGVVARAADHLAIRRTTLVEKMRKYGLQR